MSSDRIMAEEPIEKKSKRSIKSENKHEVIG